MFKETGRHLIAVGGLALSRGLTLEGLIFRMFEKLTCINIFNGDGLAIERDMKTFAGISSTVLDQVLPRCEMQISELVKKLAP